MLEIISYSLAICVTCLIVIMAYFKDFYERLICMNMLGTIGAVLIVVLGSYNYNESFFDIAIIYLLLGYVVNMAVAKSILSE